MKAKKLFTLLTALILGFSQMWGAYYTPTADEVVIIKDNMSDATNGYGTSTHGAFSFAAEITSSNKQMGSASLPIPDGSGNATYSTYKLKGNGGVKNMTLTIAGCSKLIIYNKSHSSRYIMAEITPDGESMYTENGSASTTSTEITLDGSKSYSIWIYGYDGSKQDIEVYAFKLIKATGGGDPVDVTGISISPSPAAVKVGKTITLAATITPNNATDKTVTWSIKSGSTYASVVPETGVVTGLAEGTAVITATANDGSGVTEDVTVNVGTCPTSGTMYKFQVATGLTDGNLTSSVPQDVVMTTENYLSFLTGGTLTGAARANVNRIKIVNGSAIGFANGADAYLEMHLDCDIEAGDIIKYTIASNNMELMAGSPTESTNKMTLDRTKTQVEVDSKLVGASALYMKRSSSSPNISYFEIYRPVYRTITLEYADGATPDGSLNVLDGTAADQPADPTWAHHRFDGWYNGASPYDWSATVSGDLTLTAHWTQLYTITYAAGDGTATGDAPTQVDKADGETFEVAANTFAVAGKDFDKWNDGTTDYAPGDTYTMDAANVVLTAIWKAAADKYTVIFKDGETTLDTKLVEVGSNPSDAGVDKTKALSTFAAWQKEGVDIALDDASWASVAKDAEITLTARWTAAYAMDVNFKDAATQALGVETALNTYHYASDASDISFEAKGLKIKTNAARFYFNVAPGKVAEIKFGDISGATYSVDGGAAETLSASQLKATYSASAQSCVMTMTTAAYNIVENVVIHDPYTVSFDVNGGDASIANMAATPSITLPTPTKGSESFLGWFDALDNKIGEGGATYTPAADIELVAHWEAVSTDTRISALTYTIGGGAPVDIYEADKNTFNIALPYAQAYDAITVAVTPNHASATIKAGAELTVSSIPGTATFTIVAQSGAEENYTVNFTKGPKDGVCIIKGNVGDNTFVIDEAASLFEGTADKNNVRSSSADYDGKTGWKFNSRPARLGLTLSGDETFQEGDVVEVFVTSVANISGANDKMRIFDANDATSTHVLIESPEDMVQGANRFVLPATTTKSLYLHRSNGGDYDNFNPFVAYFAVYRPMNPMLTAITINGETGTINESAKTVAVELQPGYDLADLTIVPTIVSNTDEASVVKTVTSNGGAWVIGDNTYRLTDKDGDYTEYTVTLSAGALKHTVTFDAQGGSAVDPQQVVDGENPVVPTAPTKDDYIFQGWSETTDGAVVDVTTFTINAPKTFYAIWASDGAIKLLDGSTVNHTNFITGVTASTVEIESVDYNCVATVGNTSAVNNSNTKNHDRVIAYNATTTQTKIQLSLYNSNGSARSIEVKGVIEGTTDIVNLGTINLTGNEKKVTEYIEFNNVKNRTIYIYTTSNAGHIKILQVKVLETGTALPMAGDAGYSFNLNQGRLFGKQTNAFAFEGLNIEYLAQDYTPLSSTVGRFALNTSISFTVASDVTMSLTAADNKTYYVTKGAAGTDNETSVAGVSEFALTAGTWYITAGAEDMQFTNIAFTAPKCAEPSFASLTNSDICAGDPYVALDGTATVADAGVPTYQWYNADGDVELVGETGATYTPSADGSYYVIATNHLAGFADNAKQSATVTVTTFASANITSAPLNQRGTAGDDATLTVAATGKNLSYQWFTCDNEAGDDPTVMTGEENASLTVTIPSGTQWYKVVVSSDCGNVEATAKVEEFIPVTPQNVTESTTWDWKSTTAGFPTENSSIDFANTSVEELLANVSSLMPNNDAFHSDMLYGIGQRAWRKSNNDGECGFQGFQLRFHTEVAGRVRVYFRAPSSGQTSVVRINGNEAGSRGNSWGWSQYVFVDANTDVVIAMTNGETGMTRVQKLEFQTPDYTRTDMLGNGVLGTLCVDHNVPVEGIQGATFYELAGKNAEGKIAFDQITTGQLEAGVPYVFQANGDKLMLYYGATSVTEPDNSGALKGTFTTTTIENTDPNWANIYYFAKTALWSCADLTSLSLPANRAYLVMSEVGDASPSPAPGRIRMTLNVNGAPQVTTGLEEITNDQSQMTDKVIIDGRLYILRGEKMYDATGRLVK